VPQVRVPHFGTLTWGLLHLARIVGVPREVNRELLF
jgi:hypothetical protein